MLHNKMLSSTIQRNFTGCDDLPNGVALLYGFDAKTTDSLSKCSHGLMCNLRFGLGYCFRINSMTALYCTFLNLSVKHELHYLQLNSMANANAIIIYTRPYKSCSVPVCVCLCALACVCVCVCLYPPFSTRRSDSNQILHAYMRIDPGIIRAQNKLTHPPQGDFRGSKKKSGK